MTSARAGSPASCSRRVVGRGDAAGREPRPAGRAADAVASLVMPLRPLGDDPRALWLGEGVALLVADGLTALGRPAVPRTDRVAAFDALELPADRELSRATLLRAAQVMGVRDLVTGTVERRGRDAHGRRSAVVQVEAGRGQPEIREQGRCATSLAIAGRVAAADCRRRRPRRRRGRRSTRRPRSRCSRRSSRDWSPRRRPRSSASSSRPSRRRRSTRVRSWRSGRSAPSEEQHARALAAAQAVPGLVALQPPRAVRRRPVAHPSQALGRGVRGLQDPARRVGERRRSTTTSASIQARRGSVTAQTGKPAWYFTKAAEPAPGVARLLLQPRLCLLARQGHAGRHLLAARGRAAAARRRRSALRAGGGAAGDRHHRRGDARTRPGAAAVVALRRMGQAAARGRRRRRAARPRAAERRRDDARCASIRRWSRRRSRTTSSWRASTSIAACGWPSSSRIARRSREFRKSLYLSPYDAQTHLALGRVLVRAGPAARRHRVA